MKISFMIISAASAEKILRRMALQIAERNYDKPGVVIIGIRENGAAIATEIASSLEEHFKGDIQRIELSIDKKQPADIRLEPAADLRDKIVVLIDDVANSGRTMLYAMCGLLEQRPAEIQTLALVERTHKHFPVALNYVGLSLATSENEYIEVKVENGKIAGAQLR